VFIILLLERISSIWITTFSRASEIEVIRMTF
jgi:hypothetical protein